MKTTDCLLFLSSGFWLLAAASPTAFAAAIPVESRISAATVYADRAVVTRSAHIGSLPAGANELTFTQLPAGLVEASLQVNGSGAANATILDVSARIAHSTTTANADEKNLEDELEGLRQQDRALADKDQLLSRQRDLLGQIETAATRPPVAAKDAPAGPPPPTFEQWQQLLTFSADQTKKLADALREVDRDRAILAAKLAATTARLDDLRGRRTAGKATTTVTVRLTAASAGALDLTLGYAVPNASWAPVYDARLRTEKRTIELGYFGLVRNGTGEDWKEVALTLSTARPSLGGGVTEPAPWILDVAQPVAFFGSNEGGLAKNVNGGTLQLSGAISYPGAGAGGTFLTSGNANLSSNNSIVNPSVGADGTLFDSFHNDSTLAYQGASLQTGATSATFKIDGTSTLATDNTPQRVAINSQTLKALLQYQAMPRATETVYLTAYANNGSEFPLLAGTLNVFLDDNFVATSALPTVMPAERFHLALGADEAISLKRRTIPRLGGDTGFTGKYRLVTYEYLVTLTNHKKTTERVMFKDVLPVSRDEKIKVTLLAPAERDLLKPETIAVPGSLPKPGITKEEDGKLVWRADLAPGEKREFPLKFTVEYPADVSVSGLQ